MGTKQKLNRVSIETDPERDPRRLRRIIELASEQMLSDSDLPRKLAEYIERENKVHRLFEFLSDNHAPEALQADFDDIVHKPKVDIDACVMRARFRMIWDEEAQSDRK